MSNELNQEEKTAATKAKRAVALQKARDAKAAKRISDEANPSIEVKSTIELNTQINPYMKYGNLWENVFLTLLRNRNVMAGNGVSETIKATNEIIGILKREGYIGQI